MVSLLDIAPATEKVSVAGVDVDVFGVSAKQLAAVLGRFPALVQLFAGRQPEASEVVVMAPEAVAAIIAAGTGHLGEMEHEEAAARLTIEHQVDLLSAIMRVTLPRGIGPFVEKLKGMGLVTEAVRQSGKAVSTSLPKQSKGS